MLEPGNFRIRETGDKGDASCDGTDALYHRLVRVSSEVRSGGGSRKQASSRWPHAAAASGADLVAEVTSDCCTVWRSHSASGRCLQD